LSAHRGLNGRKKKRTKRCVAIYDHVVRAARSPFTGLFMSIKKQVEVALVLGSALVAVVLGTVVGVLLFALVLTLLRVV
jgi:hypothetical protein